MAKSKLKSTLFRSKFIFAVFAVGFAGLGTYLITNSSAGPATGYGGVSVRVVEAGVNGILNGNVVPNATIHIVAVPLENTYNCSQAPSPTDWGNSTGSGTGFFTCATWNGGRLYQADAGKSGYTSVGPRQFTIFPGANTQINLTLRLNDGDHDGYADIYDACPSQGDRGYGLNGQGCPFGAPTATATLNTPATAKYGQNFSFTWSSANAVSCNITGRYAPGANAAPSGTINTNITQNESFGIYCTNADGVNGPGFTKTINVDKACPSNQTGTMPNCTTPGCPQGQVGTYPNDCHAPVIPCPVGYSGNPCTKTIIVDRTTTTPPRVVTRTVTGGQTNSSDKEKPTVPANFKGEQVGGGEVDLTWDASTDNVGVTGYTLERSEAGAEWTMLDDAITDTSYADSTAEFDATYTYRLSAKDAAGNFSDYVLVDISTNEFEANVKADEDSTLTSDDGIVEVEFPAGALKEDAFCEITKDSVSGAPKGYKLAAGGYTIECRNKAGDSITELEKDIKVTMHLKSYAKKFSSFAAYSIDGSSLSPLQSTFDSASSDLNFELDELVTFAAYGAKKSSMWWIWVLVALAVVGIILLILKLRGGGGGSDDYYDTTDYVSMPPNQGGPLDTGGGYEHHPSLPEMVAGGDQQPYPPQQNPPQAGPNNYPNPPLPPQQ